MCDDGEVSIVKSSMKSSIVFRAQLRLETPNVYWYQHAPL